MGGRKGNEKGQKGRGRGSGRSNNHNNGNKNNTGCTLGLSAQPDGVPGQYPAWWDAIGNPGEEPPSQAHMTQSVAKFFADVASAQYAQSAAAHTKLDSDDFLGRWADSLGNAVQVYSTDAYVTRLKATLSKPPRADVHLSMKPVQIGGGWQCGNSVLDPSCPNSASQVHWIAASGRVSVWVRLPSDTSVPGTPASVPASAAPSSPLVAPLPDAAVPLEPEPEAEAATMAE